MDRDHLRGDIEQHPQPIGQHAPIGQRGIGGAGHGRAAAGRADLVDGRPRAGGRADVAPLTLELIEATDADRAQLADACEPFNCDHRPMREVIAGALIGQLTQEGRRVALAAVRVDGRAVWVLACVSHAEGFSVANLLPAVLRFFAPDGVRFVRFVTQHLGLVRRATARGASLAGFLISYTEGA